MASFIHNDGAAVEIPLRLVVYVTITAAIVTVAAIGLQYTKNPMTSNIMEKQLGQIKVSLATMQYGAARSLIDPASPTGNMRTFKITIPEDVEYLAFGADPDPDNDFDLTNTNEDSLTGRGNVIFYGSRTGGKISVPLDDSIEVREGLLENGRWVMNNAKGKQYGVVIRGSGKFEITFELVYNPVSKEKYTLAHFTDDLNAYINPYDHTILPNSVWVSVDPNSIPADGTTKASVIVQLRDKRGRYAARDGIEMNLTATNGTLASAKLITIKGRNSTDITSDLIGTVMITASSAGLNPGSAYLTVTQVPVVLEIKEWINDSTPKNISFSTRQDSKYTVYFSGSGTEAFWEWPEARIEIDGTLIGEENIDNPTVVTKTYSQTTLPAGAHTLSIKMTNDFYIPWVGDRNLYAESVKLSE